MRFSYTPSHKYDQTQLIGRPTRRYARYDQTLSDEQKNRVWTLVLGYPNAGNEGAPTPLQKERFLSVFSTLARPIHAYEECTLPSKKQLKSAMTALTIFDQSLNGNSLATRDRADHQSPHTNLLNLTDSSK